MIRTDGRLVEVKVQIEAPGRLVDGVNQDGAYSNNVGGFLDATQGVMSRDLCPRRGRFSSH